jgi:hypothetical protein
MNAALLNNHFMQLEARIEFGYTCSTAVVTASRNDKLYTAQTLSHIQSNGRF